MPKAWNRNQIACHMLTETFMYKGEEMSTLQYFLGRRSTKRKKYRLYNEKGTTCVRCGAIGDRIIVWQEDVQVGTPHRHADLFGLNSYGHLVMITQDHIIPKSRGGSNFLENLQPMCWNCNHKKADKLEEELDGFKKAQEPQKADSYSNAQGSVGSQGQHPPCSIPRSQKTS